MKIKKKTNLVHMELEPVMYEAGFFFSNLPFWVFSWLLFFGRGGEIVQRAIARRCLWCVLLFKHLLKYLSLEIKNNNQKNICIQSSRSTEVVKHYSLWEKKSIATRNCHAPCLWQSAMVKERQVSAGVTLRKQTFTNLVFLLHTWHIIYIQSLSRCIYIYT